MPNCSELKKKRLFCPLVFQQDMSGTTASGDTLEGGYRASTAQSYLLFSSPLTLTLLRSSGAATPTVKGLLGIGSPP